MFGLFKKKYKIYCQGCGEEIVRRGGYVSNEGKIYCLKEISGIFIGRMNDSSFSVEYMVSEEIQQLIEEGKLTNFGKLERSLKR